jgi:hypothetical protein
MPKKRLRYRGKKGSLPPDSQKRQKEPREITGEEIKDAITLINDAINLINKGQVEKAINAVENAKNKLIEHGRQKTQPQGAPPASRREAEAYLGAALQKLRDAIRLGPGSDGFKANLQQANSLLQDALDVLSNPTAGSTPYLGRKLLLLTKTLSSVPSTARSHRQRAKNEDILEKETI